MKPKTEFNQNKALHSLAVADFMRTWAPVLKLNPDHAWIIGYVHDVGCVNGSIGHSINGYNMMVGLSKELAHYISIHDNGGHIKNDMEFLLKLADYSIDHEGNLVGISERKKRMSLRDGVDVSKAVENQLNILEEYARSNGYIELYNLCS